MALIADSLLLIAALSAAFYCRVLAKRLRRLGATDTGLGGAISSLTVQVDEMKSALATVADTADRQSKDLSDLTGKASVAARRLELLLASLHQTSEPTSDPPVPSPTLHLSTEDRVVQKARDRNADRGRSRLLRRSLKHSAAGTGR